MRRIAELAATLVGAWLCCIPVPAAHAGILITIDKAAQRMTVEIDGRTRHVWPVSTGKRGEYETPVGDFQPFRMVADHYSKEWDEAPMPHAIFFTGSGHAIHGSFATGRLGRRASHGCVRLSTSNAEKLFELVRRKGLSNTQVVVLPDPNAPILAKRKQPATIQQARKLAPVPVQAATVASTKSMGIPGIAMTPAESPYVYGPMLPAATPPVAEQPSLALPVVATEAEGQTITN